MFSLLNFYGKEDVELIEATYLRIYLLVSRYLSLKTMEFTEFKGIHTHIHTYTQTYINKPGKINDDFVDYLRFDLSKLFCFVSFVNLCSLPISRNTKDRHNWILHPSQDSQTLDSALWATQSLFSLTKINFISAQQSAIIYPQGKSI